MNKIKKRLKEAREKLAIANNTVYKQMKHIEMLNRQLDLQDKVIQGWLDVHKRSKV